MFLILICLFSISVQLCLSRPPSTSNSAVVKLTNDNFDQLVVNRQPEEAWIVMFHVSWCKACKKTMPEFIAASGSWESKGRGTRVRFGEVECTTNKELRERLDVHSYPTIMMWAAAAQSSGQASQYTYNGVRTQEALLDYIEFMTRENVEKLNSLQEMEARPERDIHSRVILATRDPKADHSSFEEVASTLKDQHSFFIILAPRAASDLSTHIGRSHHSCDFNEEACLVILSPSRPTSTFEVGDRRTYAKVVRASEVMSSAATMQEWIDGHAFPGNASPSTSILPQQVTDAVVVAADPDTKDRNQQAWSELERAFANETLAEHFRFGILDGAYWASTLTSNWGIHQYDLPRVIVFKGNEQDLYWEDADELRVGSLAQGLDLILTGRLEPRNRRDNVVLNRLANNLYYPIRHFVSQSSLHLIGSLLTLLVLLLVVTRCIYETCGLIFIDDNGADTEEQIEKIRAIAAAERRKKKQQ
ncbi:Dynein regulatory complex subunit 4 [Perkinsus olseni]|uniref:Dynein regulatory complex subunit 4 n=1 Tax=Perkinsus olseni TaxID=32597 RepID=A0A7J6LHG2_PEROL|nr:Dynein regulatory complex subunit 4 [Perkinsus olseni]